MKIGVYTIAKNEEQFTKRFMDCLVGEADEIVVLDTGSTDKTVESLRDQGAKVEVGIFKPWRFDDARNTSLALLSSDVDIAVCIDLDEILTPGWRQAVEEAWTAETTRLRYWYVWSHQEDGSPGIAFWYDKIHRRDMYRWTRPVHEILTPKASMKEVQTFANGFELHHWPDNTKSRGSYLPLLELSVKEMPYDDRNRHYLGREYMFYNRYDDAIRELKHHLGMPNATWAAERAASMRFIGRCYQYKGELEEAERWFIRSCGEAPTEREPWIELAKFQYTKQDWEGVYSACKRALIIPDKSQSYIREPFAWNHEPYDMLGQAAWWLGLKHEGIKHMKTAIEVCPVSSEIPRLKKNLELCEHLIQQVTA